MPSSSIFKLSLHVHKASNILFCKESLTLGLDPEWLCESGPGQKGKMASSTLHVKWVKGFILFHKIFQRLHAYLSCNEMLHLQYKKIKTNKFNW